MPYLERLWVPWWWWLAALLLVGSVAAAVFAYLPIPLGVSITALFAVAVSVILLGYGQLTIRVSDTELMVGRNRIQGRWLAGATALTATEAAAALGPQADPRDFLQTRPYLAELVQVELADPADPHPHWLISSRRPADLAAAISKLAGANK